MVKMLENTKFIFNAYSILIFLNHLKNVQLKNNRNGSFTCYKKYTYFLLYL